MINYDIAQYCCEHCLLNSVLNVMFEIQEEKCGDYSSVAIMCNEERAEKLIKILGSSSVNDFEFEYTYLNFDKSNYFDEYVVIINTDGEVSVEMAYYDDGELQPFDDDFIFIDGECSSKLFINQVDINENNVISFVIESDEE